MTPEQEAALAAVRSRMSSTAQAAQPPADGMTPEQSAALSAVRGRMQPTGTVEDVVKSGGAGVARGAAQLAGLPGTLIGLSNDAGNYLARKAGIENPDVGKYNPLSYVGLPTGDRLESGLADITDGATEYAPKTTAGRYAGAVGEFLPGAAAATLSGGTSLLGKAVSAGRSAFGAGLASEGAGDLAETYDNGKYAEYAPYARAAGAVLGDVASGRASRKLRGIISPGAGANPERLRNAAVLDEAGIPVTAGQATGNRGVMAIEGSTPKGQAMTSNQEAAYTAAAMRTIGSRARLATPEALNNAADDIVHTLNGVADSTTTIPSMAVVNKLDDGIADYASGLTSQTDMVPSVISGMRTDMEAAAQAGVAINGAVMKKWRSLLNQHMKSTTNPALRSLYKRGIDSLDDAVEEALVAAGRSGDLAALRKARVQYRNYLAIRDASLKADNGILTPSHVKSALASQGKAALASGRRGDLGDISMAAFNVMDKLPPPAPLGGMARNIKNMAASGGLGYYGSLYAGLPGAIIGGAAGYTIPWALEKGSDLARSALMTGWGQSYLKNQAMAPVGQQASTIASMSSGVPAGFAKGGKVMSHEVIADQLVRAAERAKTEIGKTTEPLLDQPDEAISKALEVANRSI